MKRLTSAQLFDAPKRARKIKARLARAKLQIVAARKRAAAFDDALAKFYERWKANPLVIDKWFAVQASSPRADAQARAEKLRMAHDDQCSFAAAVEETKFLPFVLPLNWNFRPQWQLSFFGPIKIWHDYVEPPPFFAEMRKYYEQGESIIQYNQAMPPPR